MNDWQTGNPGNQPNSPMDLKMDRFSMLALLFGVISLITITTVIFPIFFGSLAVIFAVLSKTEDCKMSSPAKIGSIASLASIVIAILMMVTVLYLINNDTEYHDQFNNYFQQIYGITFDEYWHLMKGLNENKELPPLPADSTPSFEEYYHSLEDYINGNADVQNIPGDSGTGGAP
ncbi:MAG TPA: hypothetical protein PLZ77_06665 [Lachnospiraceae bacterium]|nr:hypothetical protein [Lachnospiraceae bacterium]